eukprot:721222-Ditylum_brightwellii.AAC.1
MSSSTATNGTAMTSTQTSKLSWDDNNNNNEDPVQEAMDMEAAQELGGKTNGKVELNTEEDPSEEEAPSAAELMKVCGKVALHQESGYKIDIKVEWKMKNGMTRFNLRIALITLMKHMQQVDPKAYFQSGVTEKYFKNPDEIPTGDMFSKDFVTKQD